MWCHTAPKSTPDPLLRGQRGPFFPSAPLLALLLHPTPPPQTQPPPPHSPFLTPMGTDPPTPPVSSVSPHPHGCSPPYFPSPGLDPVSPHTRGPPHPNLGLSPTPIPPYPAPPPQAQLTLTFPSPSLSPRSSPDMPPSPAPPYPAPERRAEPLEPPGRGAPPQRGLPSSEYRDSRAGPHRASVSPGAAGGAGDPGVPSDAQDPPQMPRAQPPAQPVSEVDRDVVSPDPPDPSVMATPQVPPRTHRPSCTHRRFSTTSWGSWRSSWTG